MSRYVRKRNSPCWAPNTHELHQRPLHSAKLTVWCAISSHGITGLCLFDNAEGRTVTVNAQRYKFTLETFLRNSYALVSAICCGSHKTKQLLTQRRFPYKSLRQCFRAD
jgi:hypothetical protein